MDIFTIIIIAIVIGCLGILWAALYVAVKHDTNNPNWYRGKEKTRGEREGEAPNG